MSQRKLDPEYIRIAHARGETAAEIAETLHCAAASVRRWLARLDLRPNSVRDEVRLMRHVEKVGNGCWLWTGGRNAATGYTSASLNGKTLSAHVVMYIVFKGPIPDGYEVDHLCHNHDFSCPGGSGCAHRRCVNPDHLEAVPPAINNRRRSARITHCPQGHEYTPENTMFRSNRNNRHCRACNKDRQRRRRQIARQGAIGTRA